MAAASLSPRALRDTAYHEAGHAVAGFYLHQRGRRATIIPRGNSLGHVTHHPIKFGRQGVFDGSPRGLERAENRILICLAGGLAQRKVSPQSRWRQGAESDFESVRELFNHLAGEDVEANTLYYKWLWRRAELLVDLRWKGIKAVAAALLTHRTLDRTAVSGAIDRVYGLAPLAIRIAVAREG